MKTPLRLSAIAFVALLAWHAASAQGAGPSTPAAKTSKEIATSFPRKDICDALAIGREYLKNETWKKAV